VNWDHHRAGSIGFLVIRRLLLIGTAECKQLIGTLSELSDEEGGWLLDILQAGYQSSKDDDSEDVMKGEILSLFLRAACNPEKIHSRNLGTGRADAWGGCRELFERLLKVDDSKYCREYFLPKCGEGGGGARC